MTDDTKAPAVAIGAGEVERVRRWISEAIERADKHGNTEGIWLQARQWRIVLAALAPASASIPADVEREVARMRETARDWRRPALAQVEGPNDLKIYGGTIADDIDRWANQIAALAARPSTGEKAS